MNRPDVDAIEQTATRTTWYWDDSNRATKDVKALVDYVRELETVIERLSGLPEGSYKHLPSEQELLDNVTNGETK